MSAHIRLDEPLAKHNSWRVGGLAKVFFMPESVDELSIFLKHNTLTPILFLGLGSNILIGNNGFDGVVVSTKKLTELSVEQSSICAQAGVGLAKLARFANQNQQSGFSFFAGIPGTVGGALAMNAGAFGAETWQFVRAVKTIDKQGVLYTRAPKDFTIGYRQVLPLYTGEYFLSAEFYGKNIPSNPDSTIRALLKKRNDSQPIGTASCGSVFKNPKPFFAGELIEKAGLKKHRIGGAFVSDKHANFIINDGTASPNDITQLINFIQQQVWTKFGVKLETEVKIIQ